MLVRSSVSPAPSLSSAWWITSYAVSIRPIDPNPGSIPSQFEVTMKRNIVSTRGRKRLAFSGPATLSARLRKNSTTASTAPCKRPGVSSIRRDTTNEMTARTAMVSQGGDHRVGDREVAEEGLGRDRLRGQLDVSERRSQESAAELVAESSPCQADHECDCNESEKGQRFGAAQEPGHYLNSPSSSSRCRWSRPPAASGTCRWRPERFPDPDRTA